ncbi:hypothetical protein FQN49_008315, partial [Arthroderma sp. PD_2]
GRSGSSSPSVRTDRSTRTDKSNRTEKSYRSTTSDHTHAHNNLQNDSANPGSPSSERGALSRSPPSQNTPTPPSVPSQRHANRSHTINSTSHGIPQFPMPPPPPAPAQPQQPQPQPQLQQQPRGSTRNRSKTGGVQMVLEETGSWSGLADQTPTGDAFANGNGTDANVNPNGNGSGASGGPGSGSGGMFSFFSRKKGRERSPKPSERGVLGKEGARVVISG